jgi:hypothetical protein
MTKTVIVAIFMSLMGCKDNVIKDDRFNQFLSLRAPQFKDYQKHLCRYQISDTTFFNNISIANINNNVYDTLFVALYKTNCDSLYSIRPSKIDYYSCIGDSFKITGSDLMFLGKPDKVVPLTKGEFADFFVLAKNYMNGETGYKYWYSFQVDSFYMRKTIVLQSPTLCAVVKPDKE